MLSAIFSSVGMSIINSFFASAVDAFKAYENKVISVEQLKDQLYAIMANAIRDVEVAQAETLSKTYASFMQALTQSKILQRTWAFVTISQACMLLWFQLGIPFIVAIGLVTRWPSSGDTAAWSYALVGACLGMGPMVLKGGASGTNIADKLKSLISK